MEMMAPNANGRLRPPLAASTTAPMVGGLEDGSTETVICEVPVSFATAAFAVKVTVGDALPGSQVAFHEPLPTDVSARGASPFEKSTVTLPVVTGVPQSSLTATASVTGKPNVKLAPGPRLVNVITNLLGMQKEPTVML